MPALAEAIGKVGWAVCFIRQCQVRLPIRQCLGQEGETSSPAPVSALALHLTKQVQVAAADRQYLVASLQVDVRGLVVAAGHMRDRTQVHND